MQQYEIEFAVREACAMQLGLEQSIKFVMRMSKCSRDQAKDALQKFNRSVVYSH